MPNFTEFITASPVCEYHLSNEQSTLEWVLFSPSIEGGVLQHPPLSAPGSTYFHQFWSSALLNNIKINNCSINLATVYSWKTLGYKLLSEKVILLLWVWPYYWVWEGWILWSLICWHYIVWQLWVAHREVSRLWTNIIVVVATNGLHSKNAPSCGHICKCTYIYKKIKCLVHAEIFKSIKHDI